MLSTLLYIQARDDDSLIIRRSRSLAILLLLLIGVTAVLAVADLIITGTLDGALINGAAILIFVMIYLINRSGRLALATTLFLAGLSILPISAAVLLRTPIPQIYFPCLIVVIAAAFGRPRAPLIWAGVATLIPFVINLVLYGLL
ncbi:MAG: hypothetical protein ABI901_17685, partial [Roseiflexaceae bacterium]